MPAQTEQKQQVNVPVTKRMSQMDIPELQSELASLKIDSASTDKTVLCARISTGQHLADLSSADSAVREKAISELAASVSSVQGAELAIAIREINLVATLQKILGTSGKKAAAARESAAKAVSALLAACDTTALPLLTPLLSSLLEICGDKAKGPRVAGLACVSDFIQGAGQFAPALFLPELLKKPNQWQANESRLNLITSMCKLDPEATALCLSEALPIVAKELQDAKVKVQDAARQCVEALVSLCTNQDVLPLVPTLLSALENPSEIVQCVSTLASTTFVQEVDGPTLSVISPILVRGFANRSTSTKRACARIVENMSKLVEHPTDLVSFLPKILPRLESAREHVSDPEARKVCGSAADVLKEKATLKKGQQLPGSPAEMLTSLKEFVTLDSENADLEVFVQFSSVLISALAAQNNTDAAKWAETLTPYLSCVADSSKIPEVIEKLLAKIEAGRKGEDEEDEKDEGEELCNCEFSLAYGNKVLLRKTKLRLVRGQNYGLIGQNDSGKTSLMRAIADHRVEGFPEEDELRTVFVETDIQGELSDLSVLDYIMEDKLLSCMNISREEMTKTLNGVGFTADSPANVDTTVGALSGGWKMKLALARAMLLKADILLLDEPTNHLDSYNVKWVEDYLQSLEGVTCVMVSHDSGFLNRICNNIIQIKDFRLYFHRGNLTSFVEKNPAAKSFFELKTEKFKFTFPQPNRLKGINSAGKAIMKMTDISFTYPGAPKPQLKNVTIQVSLGSRVACVGVNGAGKSTMIKLLTGELEPDKGSGDVWTHPNMIYGYIAQHAFHHIESHLDKTPNEYICWRYRHGNDREALNKITSVVTEEEKKAMAAAITFENKDIETGLFTKMSGKIEKLTQSRRVNKDKKEQEYEVKLFNIEASFWILRSVLLKNGWEKTLKQVDDRITLRESQHQNPLTKSNVTKHLSDIGLEEEFSTHMSIGALSGGQKVKVVLGAALWNKPHVLILDEPTNYLDRDSLGALAAAIREFEGGVVMITHNSQFCDDLCPQVWHLENNTLNVKGDASWMSMEKFAEPEKKQPTHNVDKFGNTVEIKHKFTDLPAKQQKKLKKAREKIRKMARKKGLDLEDLEFADGYDYDEF